MDSYTINISPSDFTVSDNIDVQSFTYTPSHINVSAKILDDVFLITGMATDMDGNMAKCQYQIVVKGVVNCL